MKTVLITGGSRGIGRAAAMLFAKEGYKVIINYNQNRQAADEVADLTGGDVIQADVGDSKSVEKMFELIKDRYGKLDVVINNAGIAQQKLFTDITEAEWDRMFDVNVKGMFNICKQAVPMMVHEKQGKIINVSSIWGTVGASCEVHYSASKSAVEGFTKALAKELGPSGITVNCIAPGVIGTEMNIALTKEALDELKEETPLCRIGTPDDIAQVMLFLASTGSDFITGQIISPNGGIVIN
ncbi:MAG: 3-oxoacyl-ACP reductase FabG [Eubacteriales bacterium]|nr:3-oxoacyl-ACP reductase FabG [Eubacteriales bacterium]